MKVLLTGGSGFIAAHCLDLLLKHGHTVVTTVRSTSKGDKLIEAHPESKGKLSYVIVEDIAKEGAFDEAVKSDPPFEAILHTASPFHFNVTDAKKDLLDPAIIGTTGILKSTKAYAPTVKRIVITSSFASIVNMRNPPKVYDESSWNPYTMEETLEENNAFTTYRSSKVLAEKAAWKFLEEEKPNFDIATICPPMVFGPIVHYLNSLEGINTSNARIRDMVQGKMKDGLAPSGTYLWVDVRDVAFAHVAAMEKPEAGNNRFFVTNGFYSNGEIAEVIYKEFPDLQSKLPEDRKSDKPSDLYDYDNSKSLKVLGIKYHSLDQSISDCAKSLLEVGA